MPRANPPPYRRPGLAHHAALPPQRGPSEVRARSARLGRVAVLRGTSPIAKWGAALRHAFLRCTHRVTCLVEHRMYIVMM